MTYLTESKSDKQNSNIKNTEESSIVKKARINNINLKNIAITTETQIGKEEKSASMDGKENNSPIIRKRKIIEDEDEIDQEYEKDYADHFNNNNNSGLLQDEKEIADELEPEFDLNGNKDFQQDAIQETLQDTVQHTAQDTVQDAVQDTVQDTVPDTVPDTIQDTLQDNSQIVKTKDENEIKDEVKDETESEMKSKAASSPTIENESHIKTVALTPVVIKDSQSSLVPEAIEPPKPEPRLVIERLVLTNFKSYAGTQIVGPFNASFSAVVGPNGSGKSNVIDSLLFVFGFRASKMRQSKLSELIHNSEAFPNLKYCRVDIHFKNVIDSSDGFSNSYDNKENIENMGGSEIITTDIPNSELVVSRVANKNNSSKYYINDKESSYTEVTTLLRDKGIDLDHKRFLILQGEVESIAQMKPKAEHNSDDGLLEYLEDIIGTSKYKDSIETLLKEIDELNDVCLEKENRFQIVENAKDELEEQKNNAFGFLKKEKNLINFQSIYFQKKKFDYSNKLETNESKMTELKEKLKLDKDEFSNFNKEVQNLNNTYENLSNKLNKVNSEISNLKNIHKKQEREKVTMDEKIKYSENKKKKILKLLNSQELSLRESEATISDLNKQQETSTVRLNELNEQLEIEKAELQEIKMELSDKTKNFTHELEKYQIEIQPWKDSIDKKQADIDISKSNIEMLRGKLNEFESESKATLTRIEEINQLIKGKKKQINHLQKEFDHVTQQIQLGSGEVNEAREQLKLMDDEVSTARSKAEEAKTRVSNEKSRNRVLAALTRLSQSGRLEGFYGRLGDLGVIDDKYDIAISTGGGSLDDMVVDTVEIAQQCLDYMRKNNLGFGKFIILQKLRTFNLNRIQTPNNVPRLFDLIKPSDSKFLPAFYSSMYDTLVATNLQEANRVAFGGNRRWRVVTLDGKLVDTSGTLSGGGNRFFQGAMKLKSNASKGKEISSFELEKLIKDAQTKEETFNMAQSAFNEMEAALNTFKDRLPEIEVEISKLQMEISSLESESKIANTKLKDLKNNNNERSQLNNEIVNSEKNVLNLEREKSKLKAESQDLESKINELQKKIMDVGGVRLKMQNSKVDSVLQQLEIINEKQSSDNIKIQKLKSQIQRTTKSIESNKVEIETCETDIETIKKDYELKTEGFRNAEVKLDELSNSKDELQEKLEKIKDDLDTKQQSINELRAKELELVTQVESLERNIHGYKRKIGEYDSYLENLHVRDTSSLLPWLEEDNEERKELDQTDIIKVLTEEELKEIDEKDLEQKIGSLNEYMDEVQVDLDVLQEYARRFTEYSERKNDLNSSVERRDDMKQKCEELRKRRLDEFMTGFNMISSTLKEMYQMITMGGNAELELVDSLDPFSEGILFSVMPPKKSWKNISNLSGGEKTLSSLALVFALHRYKPTPLYVMDEIDAALDFRNVSIVANYIKERTKNAQFIVISLRNNMFELAKQLVGIYKVSNMTKSITLQNRDILH